MMNIVMIPSKETIKHAREMMTGEAFNQHTYKKNGSGQFAGNLGELAFKSWLDHHFLEHQWVAKDKKHHDFIIARRLFDVKTKARTVSAHGNYHFMVENRIKDYPCHVYVAANVVFESLENECDPSEVELCGWINKSEFWELDRDDDRKPDRFSCHKVEYRRLRQMSDLRDRIEARLYNIAWTEP